MVAAAHAQSNQADADIDDNDRSLELEEIIVTGTRIKRRDFTSISPLTTVRRESFEFSGQPTLEGYLNQMPQMLPDFGRTSNNPGDGTARLNLRGLGPDRTLVLLNGRRLAPSGVGSAVDVNNLPQVLVERVEIITGGASTVYGSDAVAGVVNFITIDDFEGLGGDASYYLTSKGDADIYDANLLYGHNLANGRGNVTVYAGYYERKPLYAAARAGTRVSYDENLDTGQLDVSGNAVVPEGAVAYPPVDLGDGPVNLIWNPDGTPRAFDSESDLYDFAPVNYLQVPLTRTTAGVMATVDIGDALQGYLEASHARNEGRQALAPAPALEALVVNTDNPVLTPETRQVFEGQMLVAPGLAGMLFVRRMLELGQRIIEPTFEYTRVVGGLRGQVGPGWELDAWVTWTNADESTLRLNDGSRARLQQGLLVNPVTGECFDPSDGCVPLDVFGEGRLSEAGADFLRVRPLENITDRRQVLASMVLTGSPFAWRPGPVDMAFGIEWRRDEGKFRADDRLFTDDSMGYRADAGVNGAERVYELYAEALVPLVDNHNNGHYLATELGVRYSNYDHAGTVWTWKAGLDWRPLGWLRFRAMGQHSVRAPNISELFREQYSELSFGVSQPAADPCSASNDPANSGFAEKCIIQGLPAEQLGSFEATAFYPVTYYLGGNPDLEPESSDTITAGLVATPTGLPELTLAIDYFDIEVTDTIGDISAFEICFDPENTAHLFCENLRRDATGNIAEISELISNRGTLHVRGVDTQVQFVRELPRLMALFEGDARMRLDMVWTHLLLLEDQENPVTRALDCLGLFGDPCTRAGFGTFPENRVIANVNYESGPMNLHLTWRWIDGMNSARPLTTQYMLHPDPKLAVPKISSISYFDVGIGYRFVERLQVRLGVSNLFDETPPLIPRLTNNTDTGMYDVFGRSYYLSLNLGR